jgi:hypothetical protein
MVKKPNRVKQAAARLGGKTALFNDLAEQRYLARWLRREDPGRSTSSQRDVQMRMDDRTDLYGRNYHRTGFERLASSALDYLRSRSSDHWLMFVVGLAIGLFLG